MSYLKRIQNEIPEILTVYPNISVFYNKSHISIHIKDIQFILEPSYPFIPPQIIIKDMPYIKFLRAPSQRINTLFQYFNISCPCCNTIICQHNWRPTMRINAIMNEIQCANQLKTKIKYKIAIDDICSKKNIDTNTIGRYIFGFLY